MVISKNVEILFFLFGILNIYRTEGYTIPEVKFEALKTGGFRVSLPDVTGTNKFTFEANINEDVSFSNPPKIKGEVSTPTNGYFIIQFDNALKVGDTIKYKVSITFGRLGYRKETESWLVTESDLQDSYAPLGATCRTSTTTINDGKPSCVGTLVILDDFDGPTIDTSKWIVEQKIPTYEGLTNELNYYHNSDDTLFFRAGVLYLKPIPAQTNAEIRATLDLRDGCTSNEPAQCLHKHKGAFIIPPVRAARITSKISFKYGKIEIRAKLPSGDWIVPVVELESTEKNSDGFRPKIYVAYSRGNDHLTGNAGDDIGGRSLYAGPVLNFTDPGRTGKLKQTVATSDEPYSNDYHTYTLEWLPGKMTFYLDSQKFGTVDTSRGFPEYDRNWNTPDAPFNKECFVSLGVAVGGIGEFPDNYKSGDHRRPWNYEEPSFTNSFFNARNFWLPTWRGDSTSLQVEYIKVWAV